ncbi:hypothetical protein GPECTOR_40g582 [Gonium pectorale]|uniref:RING-type domain-containing protein n=1 Tax=Gonium pectorale TaxID=33097 RepID=A0A150GAK0_GONPE|nr:hypothetical protein GPECTOR_40g582 [Gonium pectorale]|eukprot:KXZ46848.1 hypothetical protein GPECTOR_40g582 [Gonium pectorale]
MSRPVQPTAPLRFLRRAEGEVTFLAADCEPLPDPPVYAAALKVLGPTGGGTEDVVRAVVSNDSCVGISRWLAQRLGVPCQDLGAEGAGPLQGSTLGTRVAVLHAALRVEVLNVDGSSNALLMAPLVFVLNTDQFDLVIGRDMMHAFVDPPGSRRIVMHGVTDAASLLRDAPRLAPPRSLPPGRPGQQQPPTRPPGFRVGAVARRRALEIARSGYEHMAGLAAAPNQTPAVRAQLQTLRNLGGVLQGVLGKVVELSQLVATGAPVTSTSNAVQYVVPDAEEEEGPPGLTPRGWVGAIPGMLIGVGAVGRGGPQGPMRIVRPAVPLRHVRPEEGDVEFFDAGHPPAEGHFRFITYAVALVEPGGRRHQVVRCMLGNLSPTGISRSLADLLGLRYRRLGGAGYGPIIGKGYGTDLHALLDPLDIEVLDTAGRPALTLHAPIVFVLERTTPFDLMLGGDVMDRYGIEPITADGSLGMMRKTPGGGLAPVGGAPELVPRRLRPGEDGPMSLSWRISNSTYSEALELVRLRQEVLARRAAAQAGADPEEAEREARERAGGQLAAAAAAATAAAAAPDGDWQSPFLIAYQEAQRAEAATAGGWAGGGGGDGGGRGAGSRPAAPAAPAPPGPPPGSREWNQEWAPATIRRQTPAQQQQRQRSGRRGRGRRGGRRGRGGGRGRGQEEEEGEDEEDAGEQEGAEAATTTTTTTTTRNQPDADVRVEAAAAAASVAAPAPAALTPGGAGRPPRLPPPRRRVQARAWAEVAASHRPLGDLECPICQEAELPEQPAVVQLTCGHTGCEECMVLWLARSPTCPVCRRPVA